MMFLMHILWLHMDSIGSHPIGHFEFEPMLSLEPPGTVDAHGPVEIKEIWTCAALLLLKPQEFLVFSWLRGGTASRYPG